MVESLLNKNVGLKACNFIEVRLQHRCFSVELFLFSLFLIYFCAIVVVFTVYETFNFILLFDRCTVKKGVLRNFAKSTENRLRQSLFFNKVTGLGPVTLLKKRLWHRCFPLNFTRFLRTRFLQNTSGRLFL